MESEKHRAGSAPFFTYNKDTTGEKCWALVVRVFAG